VGFFGWVFYSQPCLEEVRAQLFESRARNRRVEVDALEQRVDLDVGLGGGGEGALSALAGCAQATQRTFVALQVLLVLPLEFVREVIDHPETKKFKICNKE
jgi:hypothetical protein